ncbi:MBL fold metallo-hydrolase [Natronocalculus amylovorans]|uniref:MBL fold metallo-hydrolase n=1 Tax=Natronocalculus amylovorans TaxID=2917812 RepID=A0AAE3FU94_9EURY|nr:MBL fold metallo-hydrolase [Natronocalculus amylovorans]MCL9815752.1 MBL fold metallo-hydrolase [Natronocalculus amylovorans]NUE01736.1 MBL fold metallo-hydrolase [Halorubraceae archaeon YAN]
MEPINVTADAPSFTCNAYLLDGEVTALIDAGSMDGVVDAIKEHVDAVDVLALTHQHTDHVGEIDAVVDAFDPAVYSYDSHPLQTHGIEDGDTIELGDETFEVVYTPGHATDHVSFVGETVLFSGDVVVYNDGAFEDGSFGRTDMSGQSRERLIESLRILLDRLPASITTLCAGHGDVFHTDPDGDSVRDVVERALGRAERREPKYPNE